MVCVARIFWGAAWKLPEDQSDLPPPTFHLPLPILRSLSLFSSPLFSFKLDILLTPQIWRKPNVRVAMRSADPADKEWSLTYLQSVPVSSSTSKLATKMPVASHLNWWVYPTEYIPGAQS